MQLEKLKSNVTSTLSASERQTLLFDWNQTQRAYPKQACLHHLFEAQVEKTPDSVAITFNQQSLSYEELNNRANQMAQHLQSLGVNTGDYVGICMARSADMVVSLLGILKVGATYLPLDPAFPVDRLLYMVADSQAAVLLTETGLLPAFVENLPSPGPQVVYFDQVEVMKGATIAENVVTNVTSNDLAYVIYTSGSTGQPKGVQLPHRAVVNFLLAMQAKPGLTADDKLVAVTTLSFDISVLEIFLPLITGAQIILADFQTAHDGARLAQLLVDSKATVMQATPATWRMLLAVNWPGNPQLKVLCGGEPLPPDLAESLLACVGSLWNMYGPTETTVWSTIYQVTNSQARILIGRPIDNTEIYILDKHLQPVPIGVSGHLYIGGDGLARGYLNRPELTGEKFIPHPFNPTPGQRIYHTGDLARYLPDGNLECLGRSDSQIKLRGYRIELGEIEARLTQHSGIKEAAVIVREDMPGGKALVAYLTETTNNAVTTAALRAFLQETLPDYMVPAYFVRLATMPLTPNRKIDRNVLPEPTAEQLISEDSYVAPRTSLEAQLAAIWETTLQRHPIGIHDNFFELGGHSLMAAQLFLQVEQEITAEPVPLAMLLQAPTIAQFASLLQTQNWQQAWTNLVPIQTKGSKPPLFCVHAAGGNILRYRDLAKYLAEADQPVYGLQSQGLDGQQPPLETVEAMAALYIQQIQAVQPHGPYLLAGYCMGGTVALEIAQRLTAQGKAVCFLGLYETYNWAYYQKPSTFGQIKFQFQRLEFHARNFFMLKPRQKKRFLQEKVRLTQERLPVWYGSLKKKMGGTTATAASKSERLSKLWAMNDLAAYSYVPTAYPGKMTVFLAQKEYDVYSGAQMRWGYISQNNVDEHCLPVYPTGMLLEPYVCTLAQHTAAAIDQALAQHNQHEIDG